MAFPRLVIVNCFPPWTWRSNSGSFNLMRISMNPPVTRSLVSIIFTFLLSNRKTYWTENFKLLLVGLLTLSLNPAWLSSISLQLSWLAALVVSMNQLYFKNAEILLKQFLFFLVLWPLLLFFQAPSPLIIVTNLILTPFLEFILFPLGLLVWLFHFYQLHLI